MKPHPTNNWLELDFVKKHLDAAQRYVAESAPSRFRQNIEQRHQGGVDFESPLETAFHLWWEAEALCGHPAHAVYLMSQKEVVLNGFTFRIDFAARPDFEREARLQADAEKYMVPMPRVAIELDGHDFHERTKEQVAQRDRRDRELQAAGWRVLHVSGSEFHRSPQTVVADLYWMCFDLFRTWQFTIYDRKYGEQYGLEPCAHTLPSSRPRRV